MPKITSIFPIPVYNSEPFDLDQNELDYINNEYSNSTINTGKNKTSKNHYILNDDKLKKLNEFIKENLNEYWFNVLQVNNECKIKITQSWINYNEKNTSHHIHSHSNSLVSGVFYVDNPTPIFFNRPSVKPFPPFAFNHKIGNHYNNERVQISCKKGSLILFPSYLFHGVGENTNDNTRISISLNSFAEGQLGSEDTLTLLKLNVI